MVGDSPFLSLPLPGRRSLVYGSSVLILFSVALFGLPNFVVRALELFPDIIRWVLTDPKTFWAVGIIFCLEWRFPANPSQSACSAAFFQDLLYFFIWSAIVAGGVHQTGLRADGFEVTSFARSSSSRSDQW
jgi:hypothetical protein